ncbi:MAG TPA: hypothetical protein VM871_03780 [Flavisolibacter sp.]|nr:hypothetical protein [Flavisolibacter sp.]
MKKVFLLLIVIATGKLSSAQKIDSIFFHLYTDSLKKGFYNYINVDGKTALGSWVPLSSNEIDFVVADSNLRFQQNDLFVDSAYRGENVTVKAVLKSNPAVWKEVTIYIRRRGFDEPLMTNEEAIKEYTKPKKKS